MVGERKAVPVPGRHVRGAAEWRGGGGLCHDVIRFENEIRVALVAMASSWDMNWLPTRHYAHDLPSRSAGFNAAEWFVGLAARCLFAGSYYVTVRQLTVFK